LIPNVLREILRRRSVRRVRERLRRKEMEEAVKTSKVEGRKKIKQTTGEAD
jgi:hypothetical protein